MNRLSLIFLFAGALLFLPGNRSLGAQADAGRFAGGVDARLMALGGGRAAPLGGGFSPATNPAALGFSAESRAFFSQEALVEDISAHAVAFAMGRDGLGFSAAFRNVDFGKTPQTDTAGQTIGHFGGEDRRIMVGSGVLIGGLWSVGVAVNRVDTRIQGFRAGAWTASAGAMVREASGRRGAGVLADHVAVVGHYRFDKVTEQIPFILRLGGWVYPAAFDRWGLTAEAARTGTSASEVSMGSEFEAVRAATHSLFLRVGHTTKWQAAGGVDGFVCGLGLGWGALTLDWAWRWFDGYGPSHLVTLATRWK